MADRQVSADIKNATDFRDVAVVNARTGRHSGDVVTIPVAIDSGQSLSGLVDLSGLVLCAVTLPNGWGSSNPMNLAFEASFVSGDTPVPYHDSNNVRILVQPGGQLSADRAFSVNPSDFMGVRGLRLASVKASDGTAQTISTDRVVKLHARVA